MASDELRWSAARILAAFDKEENTNGVEYRRINNDVSVGIKEQYELAEAYLDEHPADEADLVTDEWWLSVFGGFHVPFPTIESSFMLFCQNGNVFLHAEGSGHDDSVYCMELLNINTRGDVRLLCRALGIELKESNGHGK